MTPTSSGTARGGRAAEAAVLFVVWPLAAWLDLARVHKFIFFAAPMLYALAVYLRARPAFPPPAWPWRRLLARLALAALLFSGLVFWLMPDGWLAFPRQRPGLWALVMLLYPFVSALPQEFLYRRFFFWRYADLLPGRWMPVAVNALLFGLLHAMYDNLPAVLLSALGGLLLATTYLGARNNLRLAWIEHAVYGQLLFTLGLGRFFYEGTN